MLDDLLALFDDAEDDEPFVRLDSMTWSDQNLTLLLAVREPAGQAWARWDLTCLDVRDSAIIESYGDFSMATSSHPLARLSSEATASLYFNGAPKSADALIGALLQVHAGAVGPHVPFSRYIDPALPLRRLLTLGHGCLARGPEFLMQVYAEALGRVSIETSMVAGHAPKPWAAGGRDDREPRVIFLGRSFVVAERFEARLVGESVARAGAAAV